MKWVILGKSSPTDFLKNPFYAIVRLDPDAGIVGSTSKIRPSGLLLSDQDTSQTFQPNDHRAFNINCVFFTFLITIQQEADRKIHDHVALWKTNHGVTLSQQSIVSTIFVFCCNIL